MAKPLLDEKLWKVIEPLLPKHPPRPRGGRPSVPVRAALTQILGTVTVSTPKTPAQLSYRHTDFLSPR